MTTGLLKSVVAALRDTAAKAEEKVETKREVARHPHHIYSDDGPHFLTDMRDRFDRPYIAGRLIGMADMIEAMVPEVKEPSDG